MEEFEFPFSNGLEYVYLDDNTILIPVRGDVEHNRRVAIERTTKTKIVIPFERIRGVNVRYATEENDGFIGFTYIHNPDAKDPFNKYKSYMVKFEYRYNQRAERFLGKLLLPKPAKLQILNY